MSAGPPPAPGVEPGSPPSPAPAPAAGGQWRLCCARSAHRWYPDEPDDRRSDNPPGNADLALVRPPSFPSTRPARKKFTEEARNGIRHGDGVAGFSPACLYINYNCKING